MIIRNVELIVHFSFGELECDRLLCPYLVKYSPDVLKKKTKNTDKKCFIRINV